MEILNSNKLIVELFTSDKARNVTLATSDPHQPVLKAQRRNVRWKWVRVRAL